MRGSVRPNFWPFLSQEAGSGGVHGARVDYLGDRESQRYFEKYSEANENGLIH